MVGCVIVVEDQIIAEGYTSPYGGAHAEVNAIKAVKDESLLHKATLYVTLEPCAHFGKTPPCSDLIITHKIPRVVIGCLDEHEKVCGKGIAKLKAAGCEVTVGILEDECKLHHKRFFTHHTKKRPYIILKWAESSDGYIAPLSKSETKPVWISNTHSRQLVHQWRAEEQAILVGANTVIQDNPSLTTRDVEGANPIRIVIDLKNSLAETYQVFNSESKTIRLTADEISSEKPLASEVCKALYKHQINSVIIEGGQKTLQAFIEENLWDEARIFTGELKLDEGIQSPKINGTLRTETWIGSDCLKILRND
jgi:diaminohydroxyphosphoribosylaminopyrimidine deaminase/5-amino-6-(5-phosphoribosylamino)uracil reductase